MGPKRVACCAGVEVLNCYVLASQLAGPFSGFSPALGMGRN